MNRTRLFTFGCSFTQYCWPTWADILSREFAEFENWGECGGGNQFIFNSLIECNLKNKLQQTDTVIIMWTNIYRQDNYSNGKWSNGGNLLTLGDISLLSDTQGLLLRDLAVINAAMLLLDSIGCSYQFHIMVPIDQIDQYNIIKSPTDVNLTDILTLYKSTIDKIKPSVYEIMYHYDWYSLPTVNLQYALTCYQLIEFQKKYCRLAGDEWPTYTDFINNNLSTTSTSIINELKNYNLFEEYKQLKTIPITKTITNYIASKFYNPLDPHPLPKTHLNYIQLAMPEYKLSKETIEWVNLHHTAVLNDEIIIFDRHQPNRL